MIKHLIIIIIHKTIVSTYEKKEVRSYLQYGKKDKNIGSKEEEEVLRIYTYTNEGLILG